MVFRKPLFDIRPAAEIPDDLLLSVRTNFDRSALDERRGAERRGELD